MGLMNHPVSRLEQARASRCNRLTSSSDIEESAMKTMMIATLIGLAATGTAFAQSMPGSNDSSSTTGSSTAPSQNSQWVAPYGQPVAGKTRAQVYQELVKAEQDGQLAYLNRTLYAHH
jgi:hypothetical protein